jgi:hypothetical protein
MESECQLVVFIIRNVKPLGSSTRGLVSSFTFREYALRINFRKLNLMDNWWDSLDGQSLHPKVSTYTGQHKQKKRGHEPMPTVGFELMIPAFEWPKTALS